MTYTEDCQLKLKTRLTQLGPGIHTEEIGLCFKFQPRLLQMCLSSDDLWDEAVFQSGLAHPFESRVWFCCDEKCALGGERSHYRWLRLGILVLRAVYLHQFPSDSTIWLNWESSWACVARYGYICRSREIKAAYVKLWYRTIHLKKL